MNYVTTKACAELLLEIKHKITKLNEDESSAGVKAALPDCLKAQQHHVTNEWTHQRALMQDVVQSCKAFILLTAVRECSGDDDHVAAAMKYEFDQVLLSQLALWQLEPEKTRD